MIDPKALRLPPSTFHLLLRLIRNKVAFFAVKSQHLLFELVVLVNFVPQFFTMGIFRQIAEYLYLKKRDPNSPSTKWMRYMHGINRISLLMFIVAIIVIIIKLVVRKH